MWSSANAWSIFFILEGLFQEHLFSEFGEIQYT
jgi:hypothetical protein